jgi:hypothetical protein
MTIAELEANQLQIYYNENLNGWNWETEEYCSEDGFSTREECYANFLATAQEFGHD